MGPEQRWPARAKELPVARGPRAVGRSRAAGCAGAAQHQCAGRIPAARGDAARGQTIVGSRTVGLCLLCHSGPPSADFPLPQLQGDLATNLEGAGARWTEAQLRLRIVDSRRLNPDSLMPALHRAEGHQRVGLARQAGAGCAASRRRGGLPADVEVKPPSSLAHATPQGGRPPTARQSRFRGVKLGADPSSVAAAALRRGKLK